ncbi:MAG: phosphoglycerate mutase, partial [Chloroflexi bacterium]|nr:phosphoglycerate mutase [Chloroflexota bacterium]
VSDGEARQLIAFLDRHLGSEEVRFYAGVSYRHICVIRDANLVRAVCTPPHDVTGQRIDRNLPRGEGAPRLIDLMQQSHELLGDHEVNRARLGKGLNQANMIWLWGHGQARSLPSFRERFGVGGGVVSAVDLVKGIAKLIGLECIEVPGATGYFDTDYRAKAEYGLKCLEEKDFVLVHVEAPDEAGHEGNLKEKIKAIENFDRLVVGAMKDKLCQWPAYRVMVLSDHPTPIRLRTHTGDPVPFAWCGRGIERGEARFFNERDSVVSRLRVDDGHELIGMFILGKEQ